jgi:hypothetical protein
MPKTSLSIRLDEVDVLWLNRSDMTTTAQLRLDLAVLRGLIKLSGEYPKMTLPKAIKFVCDMIEGGVSAVPTENKPKRKRKGKKK